MRRRPRRSSRLTRRIEHHGALTVAARGGDEPPRHVAGVLQRGAAAVGDTIAVPAAAASIAFVGAEVTPPSRPDRTPCAAADRRSRCRDRPVDACGPSFARLNAVGVEARRAARARDLPRAGRTPRSTRRTRARQGSPHGPKTVTVPTTLTRAPRGGSARTNGTCSAPGGPRVTPRPPSSRAPAQVGHVARTRSRPRSSVVSSSRSR
jgi:hypothetical protein